MSYLVFHHGAYWFQIRVPKTLVARYGHLIRQNLQTAERAVAQPIAYQLAGQWLARFMAERTTGVTEFPAMSAHVAGPPGSFPQAPVSYGYDAALSVGVPAHQPPSLPAKELQPRNKLDVEDTIDSLLIYWRKLHRDCSISTLREVESVVKKFRKIIKKRPSQLERTDIASYRDRLLASGLARATVAKKVGFVSSMLQTAVDAGLLKHNVARGMRIPKPKVDVITRRAFTTDELRRIFSSSVYSQHKRYRAGGGEAAAWVPLIALATGARLEEICQLKVADILLDDEHGVLMRITDEDKDQYVKTTGSRRTIPVHPDLISAGLLDYREAVSESGYEWLFPSIEPDHDGRRGGNFGKWFARYLRSSQGCHILDRQVVFHSFRHTFKTLCREADLPEEKHDALTGHVSSSVGRGYGHMPLSTLVAAVERIQFPIKFPWIEC